METKPQPDMRGKAALIVAAMGKPPKDGESSGDDQGEGGESEAAKDDACSTMMEAVKTGDTGSFKAALTDFIDICYK